MKHSIFLIAMGLALAFAAGCGDADTAEDGTILRTVDEMEHFASFEDMVFAADLLVEGEVVGIEPGRVIETPGHREELAVATLSVERVIHRSDAVATAPDQVAIEFSRFVDLEGHGRRRIVRADGGDEFEVGEAGFYALKQTYGGVYRVVNIQGRIPVRDGAIDAPEAARTLASGDPATVRRQIEEAALKASAAP